MSSLQKKVILRLFAGDVLHGYLPSSGFVQQGEVSYLNLQGRLTAVPLSHVKLICYVRDFNLTDQRNPERLQRKNFLSRPRAEGLWVRIVFREDADVLEGIASGDTSLTDGFVQDAGIYLIPPDARTNTQRVYVPRAAMESFEVLAAIALRRKPGALILPSNPSASSQQQTSLQSPLFEHAPVPALTRGEHVKR